MVDESRFVAVEHRIKTQWEELSPIAQLNVLFSQLFLEWIIHIEKVTQSIFIVKTASHIALLFRHDFTPILTDK
jgi:hypothetical protein